MSAFIFLLFHLPTIILLLFTISRFTILSFIHSFRFLTRALEKILSDKEIKRAYHQQLKRACEVALEDLKRDAKEEEEEAKSAALPQPRGETHVTIGLNFMDHNDYFVKINLLS